MMLKSLQFFTWTACTYVFSLQAMMLDADGACLSPSSKPHICEHCNAAFRSSYHLRRHVLIHTGERLSLLVCAFFPLTLSVFPLKLYIFM